MKKFQVIATTPIDRIAHETVCGSRKAAADLAKLLNRSGYTTVIHEIVYNRHGEPHVVEAGRPRPPKKEHKR